MPQLRPTTDRVRETLFNWLMHDVQGARCLDLFAGTGILGLEALSRGAMHVDFVEQNKQLAMHLQENLKRLECEFEADIFCSDAKHWLDSYRDEPYDVAFLDPPYKMNLYPILSLIAEKKIMSPNAILYIEQSEALSLNKLPAHWSVLKQKRNGQVHYHLIQIGS